MKMKFKQIVNGVTVLYTTDGGPVKAFVDGEREPSVSAANFHAACAAVQHRTERVRQAQIEAAWSNHN